MVKNITKVEKEDHSDEEDIFNIFMGNNTNQFESDIIKSRRLFLNAKVIIKIEINFFNIRKGKMLYSTL